MIYIISFITFFNYINISRARIHWVSAPYAVPRKHITYEGTLETVLEIEDQCHYDDRCIEEA